MKKSTLSIGAVSLLSLCLALAACSTKETVQQNVSGARSAVLTIDALITQTSIQSPRSAALLGLYVAEYLTNVPRAQAADSALLGIGAQIQIYISQTTVQDPDFDLLQAFGDALEVDVPDLLNRSPDRQQALNIYTTALTNVATRSNDRYKAKTGADRDLQKAIRDKNFAEAADKQKALNDFTAQFAETDLKQKQLQDLTDTFKTLLDLYGKKISAIESNREALIAGIKVIDLPGIEELDVLEKKKTKNRKSGDFDSLFEDSSLL
jgi:hypothetical protein